MKTSKDHWRYSKFKWTNSEQATFMKSDLKYMSLKPVLEMLYIRKYTPLLTFLGCDRGCSQTDLDNAVFKTTTDIFCQLTQNVGCIWTTNSY